MVRKERRTTSASGTYRGFTLLEVVIAISIIAVTFTVLFEVLSVALSRYEDAKTKFNNIIFLDTKIKERNFEGIEIKRKRLPDFPRITEKMYIYQDVYFIELEAR